MQKNEAVDSNQESHYWSIDFVNTLDWHASPHPEETLHSYSDLVRWAKRKSLLSETKAHGLLRDAADQPKEADLALQEAIALRETIYRIIVGVIHQGEIPAADLLELNSVLAKKTHGASIVVTTDGFAWRWNVDEKALDSFLWPIVLSAAELLVSEDRQRLGQCADDHGCGWIFLDHSKNHSRRWCDIRDCGNRAKQRRHYRRLRKNIKPDP